MKDFVKESWKIAAAFAAGAFLLSLLIGLITRNPFGTVFFRALLLALLFAGLGAGLRYLARTYLLEQAAGAGPAAPDEKRGTRVDIVLDDEASPGPSSRDASAPAEDVESLDGGMETGDETARAESQALGELAEEMAEDAAVGEGGEEQAEDLEGVGGAASAPAAASGAGATDLDELPDIEPLESPEDQAGGGAARGGRMKGMRPLSRSDRESAEDAMKATMARQDPATLARALRTVLRKDEKG